MAPDLSRVGSRATGMIDPALVRYRLSEVTAPETGISIADPGLIKSIEIDRQTIRVRMTMTTPGSPMSGMPADEAGIVIAHSFLRYRVHIGLVWRPSMMSRMVGQQRQCMHTCPCTGAPAWQR